MPGPITPVVVAGAAVVASALAGLPVGQGSEVVLPDSLVRYPESTAWDIGVGEARRGWVGGSLSRTWVAVTRSGTTYAVHIRHNNAGANPIPWVVSLTGATEVEVTLGSGNQTGTQVATSVAAALVTAGLADVTSSADVVTIPNATVAYPDAVDTTDNARSGMYGYQRDTVGGSGIPGGNGNGGTSTTVLTHIPAMVNEAQGDFPASRNGRLLGVYFWGHGGHQPRLGAGSGPTHAAAVSGTPIDVLGEGVADVATASAGDFSYHVFSEPVAFSTNDELWAMIRSSSAGGPRYRLHSSSALPGDLEPTQENTIEDTTTSNLETNPFDNSGTGAEEYTPTVDSQIAIDMAVGLLYELEDASGNYAADGAIDTWHGDQNTDISHGTQFGAGPGLIDPETTWHRHELYGADVWPVVAMRRVYEDSAAGEDSRAGLYGFFDLNFPSTTAAELLGDLGLIGVTAGTGNRSFSQTFTAVDVGEAARGVGSTHVAFGTNYVTASGAALTTLTLPVFLSSNDLFADAWLDNGRRWHDDIPEANQHATASGVSEYRTTNTGMPHDSTSQTFPDPMVTDASDDSPGAIASEAYRVQRTGVAAA